MSWVVTAAMVLAWTGAGAAALFFIATYGDE